MIHKEGDNIGLLAGMENTPVCAKLISHSNSKWLQKALRYCYYMWSFEGHEIYKGLMPEKRSIRVMNDWLDGYDYKKITEVGVYQDFENAYIDLFYTAEYATYLAWQKDADGYIKLLRDVKMDIENQDSKFSMLQKAGSVIKLGKELRVVALSENIFNKGKTNDYKPRLFESL